VNNLLKKITVFLTAGALAAGCASIDVPPQPSLPASAQGDAVAPKQFFNASGTALPMTSQWWEGFNDPSMTTLVAKTLNANRQLDIAQANISIANASLARQRLETSYNVLSNAAGNIGATATPSLDIGSRTSGGLGASWEYDAFGRIAATIEAAELNVQAAEQARRDVAVIVSSETALAYVDMRGAQRRLSVAQENAQTQAQSLELLRQLFDNGRATQLDISRAESQYRTTLADSPRFQAIIDNAISRLAVLTGSAASAPDEVLVSLKNTPAPTPKFQSGFNIGSPEELIRRRPDIRAAEVEISRRLALSDIERARLFPTLSFNADITNLLNIGTDIRDITSLGLGIGPALRWEGPDLRRVRADIDIADAQTNAAYRTYEQIVIQALSDVEVALSLRLNEEKRQIDLTRAEEAAREALEIANLRFEEGIDDFLDVLDAQRTLLAAEDRLAENQLQIARLTILVYRELGGI